jgi:type II secretory ATPase GspE/PulE/Tfp pilus assembly ATPase PilB-like protein
MHHENIFPLMNVVISLESCLQYQILPLELKDNHLVLGMVNPKDIAAINCVRSIVNSFGYSVDTKLIESRTHQSVLAAYLKYLNMPAISEQPHANLDSHRTIAEIPQENESQETEKPINLHDRPTLIVDQPQEPSVAEELEANQSCSSNQLSQLSTGLDPAQLWQEVYNKMLGGGIGRLYLERLSDRGRIFCSQNGIIQFSLDRVSPSVYKAILNQVKILAKLSSDPLKERKKLAIEKYHEGERLLLRLEMFPSRWGEEGTIQVLRGKALSFYEQKQAQKMSEQALGLAIKLEKIVRKMSTYFTSEDIGDLSALLEIQNKINQHLKSLQK